MTKLQKFWQTSRFFVILYALVLAFGMVAMKFNFEFPLETMATWWWILLCAYTALDRVVDIINTKNCSKGQMAMGDLIKLRFMIYLSLALFIEAFTLTKIASANFCLEQFGVAFAGAVTTYTSGNKLVKGFKFTGADDNKDSIPDAIEEEYYKWERQQRKEGVEEQFINLGYFLDEHPELKDKI